MKRLFEYALVVIGVLSMGACQSDEYPEPEAVKEPGLYFSVNAAGGENSLVTRAMPDDEYRINSINVLYFIKNGAGTTDADYLYTGQEPITVSGNLSSVTEYKLNPPTAVNDLATTSQYWKVVFIANIASTPTGKTLAEFKNELQVTNDVLWLGSNNFSNGSPLIPMFCCTDAVILPKRPYTRLYYVNTNDAQSQTYYLLRMMAKFSIINTKVAAADFELDSDLYDFTITGISIINGYAAGLVCFNTPLSGTGANLRVSSETVSTSFTSTSSTTPTTITPSWSTVAGKSTQTISSFYTFERDVEDDAVDSQSNCYIKLTGRRLNKSEVSDTDDSNYMLPIYAVDNTNLSANTSKAGPILRNHHYQYTISGVHRHTLRVSLGVANWIPVNIAVEPLPLR